MRVRYKPYFNSIMVRLKDYSEEIQRKNHLLFQFHNGTIKSPSDIAGIEIDLEFQFHNGTIKRINGDILTNKDLSFQFHNGTIKSPPIFFVCYIFFVISIP